jgi:hypothetical protein
MAENLCVKMGGGAESETLLWENPNPTTFFARGTVTLSEGAVNFKRIRFVYRIRTPHTEPLDEASVEVPLETLQNCVLGTNRPMVGLLANTADTYCRTVFLSETDPGDYSVLYFRDTIRVGSSTDNNTTVIPIKIYGIG